MPHFTLGVFQTPAVVKPLLKKSNLDKTTLSNYMKSSDAKASKCHLKFSSRMIILIKLVYLSAVISLKWQ